MLFRPISITSTNNAFSKWRKNTFQGALAGVGWMLLACLLFSLLNVAVKFSKGYLSLQEIVLYRNLPSVLILAIIAHFRKESLKTHFLHNQWMRATVGSISMALSFYSTLHLPLALAMTLSYTHPIFLALIVLLWYKEKLGKGLIACIITGMVGVLILLRPNGSISQELTGSLAGLCAGLFAALAYLNVQALAQKGEAEWRTVFYFSLFSSIYASVAIFMTPAPMHAISWVNIGLFCALGLLGLGGQLCLTRAFSKGHANVTSIFAYSTLIFSSLWGSLFFGEIIDSISVLGGIIILASGVGTTWLKRKRPLKEAL